jgi:hypothetical protein
MNLVASTFLCCFLYQTHFSFGISAGKATALLAVKSVDAGALRHTSDHLGRPDGTPASGATIVAQACCPGSVPWILEGLLPRLP